MFKLDALVRKLARKEGIQTRFPELKLKLSSFSGWSKFFHYVRDCARKNPGAYSAFMDFSDSESGLMPNTIAIEHLKRDFSSVYELGVSAGHNGTAMTQLDSLTKREYQFWAYVCQRAEQGKPGVSGIVEVNKPERLAYERFMDDINKMYNAGACYGEQQPKRFPWVRTGLLGGLVSGLILVAGLAVSYRVIKQEVQDTKQEFRSEISLQYANAREELDRVFEEKMPTLRTEAMRTFDEYVKKHPEMMYSSERARQGVRQAMRDIVDDEDLMRDLGRAIVRGMRK